MLVQELVKFGIAGTIYFSGTKKETREKDLDGELYFHTLFMICNLSSKLLFGFSYLHFILLLTHHFLSVTMLLHLYYRLVCQDMDFSGRTSCFSLHHPKPGCSYGLPESGSTHLQCTQPDLDLISCIELLLCHGEASIQDASDFALYPYCLNSCN